MAERDPGEELAAHLAHWAAESAAAEASGARMRERWLRQQSSESATLAGVLLDRAERSAPVTVTTAAASHAGVVTAVGRDFCVVSARSATIVALAAIVSVAGAGGEEDAGGPDGDRRPPLDLGLDAVLAQLAADRSPVHLVLAGGRVVSGALASVGIDVAGVLADSGPRHVIVAIGAVDSCTLI